MYRENLGKEYYIEPAGLGDYRWESDFTLFPYKERIYFVSHNKVFVFDYYSNEIERVIDLPPVESGCPPYIFVNSYGILIYDLSAELLLHIQHASSEVSDFSHNIKNIRTLDYDICGQYFYFVEGGDETAFAYLVKEPDIISDDWYRFDMTSTIEKKGRLPFDCLKYASPIKRLDVVTGNVETVFHSIFLKEHYLTFSDNNLTMVAGKDYLFVNLGHYYRNYYEDCDGNVQKDYTSYTYEPFLINLKTKAVYQVGFDIDEKLIYFSSEKDLLLCKKGTDYYYRNIDNTYRESLLIKSLENRSVTYFDGHVALEASDFKLYEIDHFGDRIEKNLRDTFPSWALHRKSGIIKNGNTIITAGEFTKSSAFCIIEDGRFIRQIVMDEIVESYIELSKEGNSSTEPEQQYYYMTYKDYEAIGYLSHNNFILKKDSQINPSLVPSCPQSTIKARKQHEDKISGNTLLEDIEFPSISAAASFVAGASQNGNVAWKNADGITFKALNM